MILLGIALLILLYFGYFPADIRDPKTRDNSRAVFFILLGGIALALLLRHFGG